MAWAQVIRHPQGDAEERCSGPSPHRASPGEGDHQHCGRCSRSKCEAVQEPIESPPRLGKTDEWLANVNPCPPTMHELAQLHTVPPSRTSGEGSTTRKDAVDIKGVRELPRRMQLDARECCLTWGIGYNQCCSILVQTQSHRSKASPVGTGTALLYRLVAEWPALLWPCR